MALVSILSSSFMCKLEASTGTPQKLQFSALSSAELIGDCDVERKIQAAANKIVSCSGLCHHILSPVVNNRFKLLCVSTGLLALIVVPAPILPPHRFAEAVESSIGLSWSAAYLVSLVGLQAVFYSALGILAALLVRRAHTLRGLMLQIFTVPIVVVGLALVIRSIKLGRLPHWINAAVPTCACLLGVALGLAWLYRRSKAVAVGSFIFIAFTLWVFMGRTPSNLRNATELRLRRMIALAPGLPSGDERFGALLQVAFAPLQDRTLNATAIEQNRAAILAWGIVVGHPQVARLVGLDADSDLVRRATALSTGTTLRGREDWPRHYALSAALVVLEHPSISDGGGLLKEQLDAVSRGSGFSFRDLAADRAGVRLANNATGTESGAVAIQHWLQTAHPANDFFPPVYQLPEDLTVEQFRSQFGNVGSPQYQMEMSKMETLLDGCAAIARPQ